jgi:alkanesulfonate monooxygenase SsuD/methylene tetrahydromethanopterin reductase-like flavin-dependent oxidoreductase (luciferase family)
LGPPASTKSRDPCRKVGTVPLLTAPFAPGSVSLRLYPHNELPAGEVVSELCHQGRLAGEAGFDGVMTSEHHGGFPGYLPNPLQMVAFMLDRSPHGWAAACPLLLPLRPTAMVAEEAAWLAALHPGRVGLGVAAGALPLDFEVMGLSVDGAVPAFKSELPRLVDMVRGRELGPLAGDPALQRCAEHPVPVLSAAVSVAAATRAARSGAGLLMEGMSSGAALSKVTEAFDRAGGTGTKMLIRRVWLGDVRSDLVARQRQVYDGYAGKAGFGDDQTVTSTDPDQMAAQLHDVMRSAGADALNLRVHLPGMAPDSVRSQIARLGAEVLPRLREQLALGRV